MKQFIAGLGVAGAAAVLPAGIGLANADDSADSSLTGSYNGWTYDYNVSDTDALVQSTARTEDAWAIPVSFTNPQTGDLLSGIDFFRAATYGPNSEFVVTGGSEPSITDDPIIAIDRQFQNIGATSMFYSPNGYNDLTGSSAEIGGINLGSSGSWHGSWLVRPADYFTAVTASEAFSKAERQLEDVLNIGPDKVSDVSQWTVTEGKIVPVINSDGHHPIWSYQDTTASNADGDTLTGTVYNYSPPGDVGDFDEEFVTNTGAVYDETQGFLAIDNLYYDPGHGGPITDILQTPLGDLNISWLSGLFTPPDYSDYVPANPGEFVDPDDLIKAINFGLGDATQSAGATAGDAASAVAATLGSL